MQKPVLYFLLVLAFLVPSLSYSTTFLIEEVPINAQRMQKGMVPAVELYSAAVFKKPYLALKTPKPPERVIIIDPRKHKWSAYAANGKLIRSGMATAGSSWCPDIGKPCRTKIGVFRVYSLGSSGCYSKKFPVGRGGAPMPYCMFFNGGQAIHGSYNVVPANVSHGCIRVHVSDARWLRFNFINVGTKVVVRPY